VLNVCLVLVDHKQVEGQDGGWSRRFTAAVPGRVIRQNSTRVMWILVQQQTPWPCVIPVNNRLDRLPSVSHVPSVKSLCGPVIGRDHWKC